MSKDREDFEKWAIYHPTRDFNLHTDDIEGEGDYSARETCEAFQTWQAASTRYQLLLEAKDAEIDVLKDVTDSAGWLLKYEQLKNSELKALLKQAREELDKHHQYAIKFHSYYVKREKDDWQGAPSYMETKSILDAINAATGEK